MYVTSRTIRTKLMPLFLVACAITSLFPSRIAFADANQLVVTPSSLQATVNAQLPTMSIKAYIDSSQSPQSAAGTLTYPSNLLRIVGTPSTAGNGFGSPTVSAGNGTINFNASRNSSDTGFVQIFTVTFQAIGAGTAVIGFTGNSQVNGSSTSYKSSVISITNPNPAPPPQTTAPKPSSAPKPVITPTPSVSVTPIPIADPTEEEPNQAQPDPSGVVTNVLIKPRYDSATVTWTVNAANPTSTFSYGQKASVLDKQGVVTRNDDGTFTTQLSGFEPGNRYYFAINGSGASDANGTYSSTIVTTGYPVQITVTENDVAIKGAQIKIGTRTYTTESSGKRTIGLAAGTYNVTVRTDTASLTTTMVVAKKNVPGGDNAPEAQSFTYKLTSSPIAQGPGSQTSILAFVGALIIGTVVLGLGFFGIIAYRRRKFESGTGSSTYAAPTVIIDDGYRWPQETGQSPEIPAPEQPTTPVHHNSVYINEEEPQDMFDKPVDPPSAVPRNPAD